MWASELQNLRQTVEIGSAGKAERSPESIKSSNWVKAERRVEDFTGDINSLTDKVSQIARQIFTINGELEDIKRHNYISKDQFSRNLGDIVDELERKLNVINERVRERIEDMDLSMVETLRSKDDQFQKLHFDIRNIQSSMIRVTDQVNTYVHSQDSNLEDQVKKVVNSK